MSYHGGDDGYMTSTKTAVLAQDIAAGDDVLSMTHGRFRVAAVEPAEHGMVRITSTHGLVLTVTPTQLFARFNRQENTP